MVCQYEFNVAIVVIIMAFIAHYLAHKYIPAKYFYDEIEIKKCKRVQMPQQIQQFHQPDEVDGYDRITDIDAPDDNSSYYVL